MPPKGARGGGGNRGRGARGGFTPIDLTPNQHSIANKQPHQQQPAISFSISPLILEGVKTTTKVELNSILKTHFSDVKVSDIQANRSGTFTLQASDVKSFNRLLNDLSTHLNSNGQQQTVVYIPRSIQRILETDKTAFVKLIDLEITENEIKEALTTKKLEFQSVMRLFNKEKAPLKTVKIIFNDAHNRNTFVQIGLQIDSMHFIAEKANQNNKPPQCFKCMQFGHVAKYCKSLKNVCANCGDDHKIEQCLNQNQKPVCCNCKGEHLATSKDCQKLKEQQQRIQQTIDRYSSTSLKRLPNALSINDKDDFPLLTGSSSTNSTQSQIIDILTEKMLHIVEQATQQIFKSLSHKFEQLTKRLFARMELQDDEMNGIEEDDENKQQQQHMNVPQYHRLTTNNNKNQQGSKRTNSSTTSPSDLTRTNPSKQQKNANSNGVEDESDNTPGNIQNA